MTSLTDAQSQDAQARQSLQSQRDLISQNRINSSEQLNQLNKAEQKLPNQNSQLSLRQRLSGLMGQIKRNAVQKARQGIENQKQNIKNYQGQLNDYNQQLTNYETQQLQPFEAQIKNYEDYQAGYKAELNGAPVLSLIDASSSFKSGYLDAQSNEDAQQLNIALKNLDSSGLDSLNLKQQSLINNALKNGSLKINVDNGGTINNIKSLQDYNKYIKSISQDIPTLTTNPTISSNVSEYNPYNVSNLSEAFNVQPFASVGATQLNTNGGLNQNGVNSVSSGGNTGNNNSLPGKQQSGNFFSDLLSGFNKDYLQGTGQTPNLKNITGPGGIIQTVSAKPQDQTGTINVLKTYQAPEQTSFLGAPDFTSFVQGGVKEFRNLVGIPQEGLNPNPEWLTNVFPQGGKSIPYGLTPINTTEAQNNFNPWYTSDYLGAKVSNILPNSTRNSVNNFFGNSSTASALLNFGYGTTRELPKWAFFSPFFMTGTSGESTGEATAQEGSQTSKQIQEQISENQFSDIAKAQDKLASFTKKLVNSKDKAEQVKTLNDVYKTLTTPEAKTNFQEWIQSLQSQGILRGTYIFENGEIKIFSNAIKPTPKIKYSFNEDIPSMKGNSFLGSLNVQQTKNSAQIQEIPLSYSIINQNVGTDLGNLGKINENFLGSSLNQGKVSFLGSALSSLQNQKLPSQQALKLDQQLKQALQTQQETKQGQRSRQIQDVLSLQVQRSGQQPRQIQRITQKTKDVLSIRPREPPQKKIKLTFEDNPKFKRKKVFSKRDPLLFIPQEKVKGKYVSLGKFKDPLMADIVGQRETLRNLGASYRIATNTGKLIVPKPSPLFRPSKRNPFVSVQIKNKIPALNYHGRLTSQTERKQIKDTLAISKTRKKIKFF